MYEPYYSDALKCWVRLEKQADGEWCHTGGYASREDALLAGRTLKAWWQDGGKQIL